MILKKFKNSQDYIDICYMIDHIKDVKIMESVLVELGYNIGVDIVKVDNGVKHTYIGKRNDIRMQITPKYKNINMARCVIVEPSKLYFQNGA